MTMDPTCDNPYAVLGIHPSASMKEIRTAYRKAALLYHPDKAADKGTAHEHFAKISAAYEMLTDPAVAVTQQQQQQQQQRNDTPSRSYHQHFHDPFAVFESVFREEFGGGHFSRGSGFPLERPFGRSAMDRRQNRSFFDDDDFFGEDFFAGFGGGQRSNSVFGRSPFESSGGLFGNGLFGDLHQRHHDVFSSVERQMQDQGQNDSSKKNPHFFSSMSSSRSSSIRTANGETVTTTETTRTVNGQKQQHVKETITYAPDGSVKDRQTVTTNTGDNDDVDTLRLPSDHHDNNKAAAAQQHRHNLLPWWRGLRRHSIKTHNDDNDDEKTTKANNNNNNKSSRL
jgi:curved DNA-binding protein CbpA